MRKNVFLIWLPLPSRFLARAQAINGVFFFWLSNSTTHARSNESHLIVKVLLFDIEYCRISSTRGRGSSKNWSCFLPVLQPMHRKCTKRFETTDENSKLCARVRCLPHNSNRVELRTQNECLTSSLNWSCTGRSGTNYREFSSVEYEKHILRLCRWHITNLEVSKCSAPASQLTWFLLLKLNSVEIFGSRFWPDEKAVHK